MARDRPLRVEPTYRAEPVDEYRDLVMLADAWERGSLRPDVAEAIAWGEDETADRAERNTHGILRV